MIRLLSVPLLALFVFSFSDAAIAQSTPTVAVRLTVPFSFANDNAPPGGLASIYIMCAIGGSDVSYTINDQGVPKASKEWESETTTKPIAAENLIDAKKTTMSFKVPIPASVLPARVAGPAGATALGPHSITAKYICVAAPSAGVYTATSGTPHIGTQNAGPSQSMPIPQWPFKTTTVSGTISLPLPQ